MNTEMELISKKELLQKMDISYGQLYRWKRKDLIPDAWFIRKSTFTGQETFFPKAQIIERIAKIQELKDTISLDELAAVFSEDTAEVSMLREILLERKIIQEHVLEFYQEHIKSEQNVYDFRELLVMYILQSSLETGAINLAESEMLLRLLIKAYLQGNQHPTLVLLTRKMGVASCFLAELSGVIAVDEETSIVLKLDVAVEMEALKTRIKRGGGSL